MFQGHAAILVNVLGNGVNMMGQWEYDEYGYGLGNVLNAYLVGGFKHFLFSIIYEIILPID